MKTSIRQVVRSLCLASAWLALTGAISPARAQFEDIDFDVRPNQVNRHRFQVSESYFDQVVFGNSSRGQQYRRRLDAMVAMQLERYDAVCELSADQKETLRLAAQGDVKRLEDTIETLREEFAVARFDQNKFGKISQKLQPLRTRIQNGIFDEKSLLFKVVPGILDDEQTHKFEQAELQRRKENYRAKIALFVLQLQNGIPMLDDQRKQLETLLLEETEPPKAYGSYAYYIVMYQTSKLPEEKMKAIFDDAQWRAIKASLDQGRGMQQHLKQQGFLR